MRSFLMTVALTTLVSAGAQAQHTPLGTITKSFAIEGQTTTVSIDPAIAISGEPGQMNVAITARIHASDLQATLSDAINKWWKNEECGQRLRTHSATILPSGDQLFVGVTAQAQQWECIKTKVPKTYFENKCVARAFGKCRIKTKVPVIRWKMETAKTRLISQSVRLEAMVTPVFSDGQFRAHVRVTKAAPSGLAGGLVRAIGFEAILRLLVQSEVSNKVAAHKLVFPPEAMAYDPKVNQVKFVDLGGGKLGIDVAATGRITQEQIAELLSERLN